MNHLFKFAVLLVALVSITNSFQLHSTHSIPLKTRIAPLSTTPSSSRIIGTSSTQLNAVLPGDPIIVGTLTQGMSNAVGLFSNIILARFALSWFPQLTQQFTFLRPVFTVTEPYLKIFRSQIPSIGGFDISAIPAFFVLDILSQTVVAIGAEFPSTPLPPVL